MLLLVLALCKLRYCLIIDFLSSRKRPWTATAGMLQVEWKDLHNQGFKQPVLTLIYQGHFDPRGQYPGPGKNLSGLKPT